MLPKKPDTSSARTDGSVLKGASARRQPTSGSLKDAMPGFFKVAAKNDVKKISCFCELISDTGLFETEGDVIENIDHLKRTFTDYLQLRGYPLASAVLDLSIELRGDKKRDDRETYRILHDMVQAIWVLDAAESGFSTPDTELVIALNLAHDLGEEYGIRPEMLAEYLQKRGIEIDERVESYLRSFDAISKYYGEEEHKIYKTNKDTKTYKGKDIDGHYRDEPDYQGGVRSNPLASVSKMFDRIHNLMTIIGVRDKDTIHNEIAKTATYYNDFFFNEMYEAFPENREVYEMLKEIIDLQLNILRYYTQGIADSIPDDECFLGLLSMEQFNNMPAGMNAVLATARRARTYPSLKQNGALRDEPLP